jgi:hypothetical protein
MYVFRVSRTKSNGLDDEYVIMDKIKQSCVKAYQRLFPGEKVYIWRSKLTKDFISFKVKGFSDFSDGISVYVEIIDYRYEDISKKMVDIQTMRVFKHIMMLPLKIDFSICSIQTYNIRVTNESKFLLPEKRKSSKPEFKIYTGRPGFDTLRESSYLFNDDRDDDIMSYTRLLGTNRFR